MDRSQNSLQKLALLVISFVIVATLVGPTIVNAGDWQNLTSYLNVNRLTVADDTIYAATSGGLLIITEANSEAAVLLNSDGLGTVDISDVVVDLQGRKWIAGDGRLVLIENEIIRQFLFRDRDGKLIKLHRIKDDGDFLWIGTDIGLILFSKIAEGGQIQDSYGLFGTLNPEPTVLDILLTSDSIWVATTVGLAYADRSDPLLLKAPANWSTFITVGGDSILSVVPFENEYYASSMRGIYKIDLTGDSLIILDSDSVRSARLRVENDSLFYYLSRLGSDEIGHLENDLLVPFSSAISGKPVDGLFALGHRWVATSDNGILFEESGSYTRHQTIGIPFNNIIDVAVNSDGRILVGSPDFAAATYENSEWTVYPFGRPVQHVLLDARDDLWVGTDGAAMWRMDQSGPVEYDERNSTLLGNSDDPPNGLRYVDVHGIASNDQYLFAACYRANSGYPIAFAHLDDLDNRASWDSIGTTDGILTSFVTALAVHGNRVAVGTKDNGVYECFLGFDPYDHSARACSTYTSEFFEGNLLSNTIRTIAYTNDGAMWVGTNFGLSRFDLGIERFVDEELPAGAGTDILALATDQLGHVWVGTTNGVALRDPETGDYELFTAENSDLVANRINGIFVDDKTGKIYIATENGISIHRSLSGVPSSDVNKAYAFPNPFVITSSSDRLHFNYIRPADVTIYNIAGERVMEFDITSSWDGKNMSGNPVASGVYLFVIKDQSGDIGRGKIFLVRK